jgi:hypothetical protein
MCSSASYVYGRPHSCSRPIRPPTGSGTVEPLVVLALAIEDGFHREYTLDCSTAGPRNDRVGFPAGVPASASASPATTRPSSATRLLPKRVFRQPGRITGNRRRVCRTCAHFFLLKVRCCQYTNVLMSIFLYNDHRVLSPTNYENADVRERFTATGCSGPFPFPLV